MSPLDRHDDGEPPANGSFESYQVDGGTVIYDACRPLAWIESSLAVRLSDRT